VCRLKPEDRQIKTVVEDSEDSVDSVDSADVLTSKRTKEILL